MTTTIYTMDEFLLIALSSLSYRTNNSDSLFSSNFNFKTDSLHIFEKSLQAFGKTLDEYMEEISFDSNKPKGKIDNDNIIVKNEILAVFNKSKLNPDQFANLLLSNNIYIENEKPGDWTQLKVNEVEEYLYGLRKEIPKNEEDKDEEDHEKEKINKNH